MVAGGLGRCLQALKKPKILIPIVIVTVVVVLAAVLIPILVVKREKPADVEKLSMTILSTDKLPMSGSGLDFRIMPYIGNGHVATVIFSDLVFMNGIYNGENGSSHRARIPSTINWRFRMGPTMKPPSYSLDMGSGTFIETLENDQVRVERRIFASQEYTELLLAHVTVIRLAPKGQAISVAVDVNEQVTSVDYNLNVVARNDKHVLLAGTTREVEDRQFQAALLPLFMYYTPLPSSGFQLGAQDTSRTYLFVTSLDTDQTRANRSFEYASSQRQPDEIWSAHASLWNNAWRNGRVEVRGDAALQQQIDGAWYYILSSLPPLSTKSEKKQFYGLSPGSLSRGGLLGEDYGGHSFWDTETWMYPAVLLMYPTLAKEILAYRIALRDSAAYNAKLFGYEGWRFPWESARTGIDVTPDCCPEVRLYQMHITGDISFAARQYIAATGDKAWLKNEMGGDLIHETAHFWASRAVFNQQKQQYEILGVLPPDEDAVPFQNNSVYTNAVASLSIRLASAVSCVTGKTVPQGWLDVASNLHFPFDNVSQIHLEYEGFNPKNASIKQADVVLLGFPLMWPMTQEVRRNDLLTYEPITREDGPAMTWSMHAVGFLELKNYTLAQELFDRSYETYVRPPFNVWTEARSGVGAVNFITGAGGFLQAVFFGYGGIRLNIDSYEIMPPNDLPNNSTALIFHGLKYHGGTFDLTVEEKTYTVRIRTLGSDPSEALVYEHAEKNGALNVNDVISFPTGTRLTIRPKMPLCG